MKWNEWNWLRDLWVELHPGGFGTVALIPENHYLTQINWLCTKSPKSHPRQWGG